MNKKLGIEPEAFPAELVMEDPSTAFESEEPEWDLEEDLEEEARRGARSFRGSRVPANRIRGSRPRVRSQPGQQRRFARPDSRKPLPPRFPRRPVLKGRRSLVASDGDERARWVQDCLNEVMQTRLPVNGVIDAATRSAVRSFQRRENLRVTGIVGPDTEEALRRACSGAQAGPPASGVAPAETAPSESTELEWGGEIEMEESEHAAGCSCQQCHGSRRRGHWVRSGRQITLLNV